MQAQLPLNLSSIFDEIDHYPRIKSGSVTKLNKISQYFSTSLHEVEGSQNKKMLLREIYNISEPSKIIKIAKLIKSLMLTSHSNVLQCLGYDYEYRYEKKNFVFEFYIFYQPGNQTFEELKSLNPNYFDVSALKMLTTSILSAEIHFRKLGFSTLTLSPNDIFIYGEDIKILSPIDNLIQIIAHEDSFKRNPPYMAPEILEDFIEGIEKNDYNNEKTIVFSIGLVLLRAVCKMKLTGLNNRAKPNLKTEIKNVIELEAKNLNCSSFGTLIEKLLILDVDERLSIQEICDYSVSKDQFLDGIDLSSENLIGLVPNFKKSPKQTPKLRSSSIVDIPKEVLRKRNLSHDCCNDCTNCNIVSKDSKEVLLKFVLIYENRIGYYSKRKSSIINIKR